MGAKLLREVAEIGRVQIDAEWPALADPAARPGADRLHQFLLAVAELVVRNGGQAGLELGGHRGGSSGVGFYWRMYPVRSPGDQAGESRSAMADAGPRAPVAAATWLTMR